MWKKEEEPAQRSAPNPDPGSSRPPSSRTPAATATIGRSIAIRGDVTGDEDLLVQGRVDGSIELKEHAVTVGPDGIVKASIAGRIVTIEGRVEGDLTAEEQVVLRGSAQVEGDITAPRVVLEDGSRFRGGVDMGEMAEENPSKGSTGSPRTGSSGSRASKSSGTGAGAEDARASGSDAGSAKESKGASDATVKAGA